MIQVNLSVKISSGLDHTNDHYITCYWLTQIYREIGYLRAEFKYDNFIIWYFLGQTNNKKGKRRPS